jgi:hypothetical protein
MVSGQFWRQSVAMNILFIQPESFTLHKQHNNNNNRGVARQGQRTGVYFAIAFTCKLHYCPIGQCQHKWQIQEVKQHFPFDKGSHEKNEYSNFINQLNHFWGNDTNKGRC